jgi:hypothetical protein
LPSLQVRPTFAIFRVSLLFFYTYQLAHRSAIHHWHIHLTVVCSKNQQFLLRFDNKSSRDDTHILLFALLLQHHVKSLQAGALLVGGLARSRMAVVVRERRAFLDAGQLRQGNRGEDSLSQALRSLVRTL